MGETERIRRLVEASSLGTEAAKAARASVSDEQAAEILRRAGQHVRGSAGCRDLPALNPDHRYCWCPADQPAEGGGGA